MRTYEKIETIFNRDTTGTKKLILGDFRNETVKFFERYRMGIHGKDR